MNFKKIITLVKKSWLNIIFAGLFIIFILNTSAKAWFLQQLIATGLFNTEIKKDPPKELPESVAFSYADSNGIVSSIAALRGKVVFINFWASWCPPCRAEMPSLNELYLKLKDDKDLVFLFINEDDDMAKGKEYLEKSQFEIPFFSQPGNISNEIFSGTLPTTVILNKEGNIVLRHQGMAGYNTDTFIRQLKEIQ